MSNLSKKIKIILILIISTLSLFVMNGKVQAIGVGSTLTVGYQNTSCNKYQLLNNEKLYCVNHNMKLSSNETNIFKVKYKVTINGTIAKATNGKKTRTSESKRANAIMSYLLTHGNYQYGYGGKGGGTRQQAVWSYWNTWLSKVGSSIGINYNTWYGKSNSSVDGGQFLENAKDWAIKNAGFKDSESGKGAASVDKLTLKRGEEDDKNSDWRRYQFNIDKSGTVTKIKVYYEVAKKDANGNIIGYEKAEKPKVLKKGTSNLKNIKYQQLEGKEYKNKDVSKVSNKDNNYILCKKGDWRVTGIQVYVEKTVKDVPKVTLYLLYHSYKQKLIWVEHSTDNQPYKDDKLAEIDAKASLTVEKYVGTSQKDENGKDIVVIDQNNEDVSIEYILGKYNDSTKEYQYLKPNGKWGAKESAQTFKSGEKIKNLEQGKYKIVEIKVNTGNAQKEIIDVSLYRDGEESTVEKQNATEVVFKVFAYENSDIKLKIVDKGNSGSLLVRKMGQKSVLPAGYDQETAGKDVNLEENNNSQKESNEDSNDEIENGETLEEAPIEERSK